MPAGLVAALSGLWMTVVYDLPASSGATLGLLGLMRVAVGSGMAVSLLLGAAAMAEWLIRRRPTVGAYARLRSRCESRDLHARG